MRLQTSSRNHTHFFPANVNAPAYYAYNANLNKLQIIN